MYKYEYIYIQHTYKCNDVNIYRLVLIGDHTQWKGRNRKVNDGKQTCATGVIKHNSSKPPLEQADS